MDKLNTAGHHPRGCEMMISLAAALDLILRHVSPLPAETVPLAAAGQRVLADAVTADNAFPPFARSRRDGFALRAADTVLAAAGRPAELRITGRAAAGHPAALPLAPGTALRILTGAPVPAGADAVASDEEGELRGDVFSLCQPVPVGQHIEPAGAEYRPGEVLRPAGSVMSPGALALCAAAGLTAVPVVRRPTVAILTTGDELTGPGETLQPGQIHDSNGLFAAACVTQWGGRPVLYGPAPDDAAAIAARLSEGLAAADLMLTTGGTAAGECDCLPEALERLGADRLFRRIAMRPGAGTHAVVWRGKLICCLSGNPGALSVAAELLVRPVLDKLAGRRAPDRPVVEAVLTEAWHLHSPGPHYLPVRVCRAGGQYRAERGRPGMLSLAAMNGLLIAENGAGPLAAGEKVRVMLTGEVGEE